MGSCFSRGANSFADNHNLDHKSANCANIVSHDGNLRQYAVPITVSQVLELESSSTSSPSSAFFICNSDCLYFDDYIPALGPQDQLEPAQIYFVLPLAKLQYKLTASDMAALAVKASLALQTHNKNTRKPNNLYHSHKARISPVLLLEEQEKPQPPVLQGEASKFNFKINKKQHQHQPEAESSSPSLSASGSSVGFSRSGSTRKLQKFSSGRAKMAVRSFRIRLTTINEESVLFVN